MRSSGRTEDALRPVSFTLGYARHAEGSCLIRFGHTEVLCTASLEERVPSFLRGSGLGWVTAEYGMLPRATGDRVPREAKKGQSGRTVEIQRLIGRALRAVVDRDAMGEISWRIDCDVLNADGGTRTAAITGAYAALAMGLRSVEEKFNWSRPPLMDSVAAISCGLVDGVPLLDLEYVEDSRAQADTNFVFTGSGGLVEVQGTAEGAPFSEEQFLALLTLARQGTRELAALQKTALEAL